MSNIVRQPCDEGVIRSSLAAQPCTKAAAPWILAATIIGSSMAFIDGTVVNVALPALQTHLNASATDVQWVVESYALFLSALLLVGGSLGDRYGRRLIYAIGIVVFAAASVWCGLAQNVSQLIAARALQGIGGALLVPGSLAIISASFDDERRGQAIGTWSGFTAITAAIGPVMGGWLIENVSWRAVFFINVPLAIIVLILIFTHVPETRDDENRSRLDWPGAALATCGLGSLVFGLIESSRLGFRNPWVVSTLAIGATMLVVFLFWETRARNPMLPLSLFRSSVFAGANLLTLFLYSALSGLLFFLPMNLIQIQGYSATAAGAAVLPFILIMFLLSRWSGGLVKRYGARVPLIVGPLIAATGFLLFLIPSVGGSYWTTFFPATVVLGLGMAVSVAPLTTTVMSAVAENRAGIASGINNAVSRTAGLLSVAVLGILMLHSFNKALQERIAATQLPQDVQQRLLKEGSKLAGADITTTVDANTVSMVKQAINSSFVSAFRLVSLVTAGLAIASSLASLLLIRDDAKRTRAAGPPGTRAARPH